MSDVDIVKRVVAGLMLALIAVGWYALLLHYRDRVELYARQELWRDLPVLYVAAETWMIFCLLMITLITLKLIDLLVWMMSLHSGSTMAGGCALSGYSIHI